MRQSRRSPWSAPSGGTYGRLDDCRAGPEFRGAKAPPTSAVPNGQISLGFRNHVAPGRGRRGLAGFCPGGESGGRCGLRQRGSACYPVSCNRLRPASLASSRRCLPAQQRGRRTDQRSSPDRSTSVFRVEPQQVIGLRGTLGLRRPNGVRRSPSTSHQCYLILTVILFDTTGGLNGKWPASPSTS